MRRFLAAVFCAAAVIAAPSIASVEGTAALIGQAGEAIAQGDGIAAEVRLKQALGKGAPREAVAALMGEALIAQGELIRARTWLEPGAFTPDTAAAGFRTLARLEQMEGNLPAAGAAFDRVIALTPRDAEMWVEIGRLRYSGGEHVEALEAAEHAFALDPKNVRVLEFRGQIVRDQQGLVAALPWFEAALAQAPEDVSVLGDYAATLGDLGRAREMLKAVRRMAEIAPGHPRVYYLQAVLAARAGNFALARRLMERVGDQGGDIPGITLLRGVLDLEAGNHVLAAEAFEQLLRRQPANEKVRNLLVRALFQAGEYRQIVRRFAGSAERADAAPYLVTVVARAHEALGERALAAPLLDRAALARPSMVAPVSSSTPVGALLALGQIAEAEAEAEDARAARPGNFDAEAQAGDVQLIAGRGEEALVRYRLAARIRLPESLMLRMVSAYSLAGQGDAAQALIERYLRQNPTSDAAMRLAARQAMEAGAWPRARALLENLEEQGGGRDVRLLTDLSLARLRSGDAAGAEASAARAYRLQRASPLAAQGWGQALAALGRKRALADALLAKAARMIG